MQDHEKLLQGVCRGATGEAELYLKHDLKPHFPRLRDYRNRKQLRRSPLYQSIEPEIHRTLAGVEWRNVFETTVPSRPFLRVVAWNIERGKQIEGVIHYLREHPILKLADVLLITETDIGMGRTGNRNIPRELSDALQLNYCYANLFLNLAAGDEGEQEHSLENDLSLHGLTLLSKTPISAYKVVPLPDTTDVFRKMEKQLGGRRALICSLEWAGKLLDLAVVHLEVVSSPVQRATQMCALLRAMKESTTSHQLIGGDFNTCTYHLSSKFGLVANLLHKIFVMGFSETIRHYLTPDALYDRPLFTELTQHGFDYETFNDRSKGTLHYDIYDQVTHSKSLKYVPKAFLRWLERKLRPWNGRVPLRLDWFGGKGFRLGEKADGALPPQVVENLRWQGKPVSDHDPIVVDLVP